MEFRQSLFWDVDPELIDVNKNANYIIERILDFGNDEEVKWVWKNYDKLTIKKALESSRSFRKESKNLWNLILEKK